MMEKLAEYRQIPTVTDYVMIAQYRMFVTHYAHHVSLPWTVADYTQPTDALTFTSLGVSMSLEDIYLDIFLPPST